MKICLISNLFPPYNRGGAEQVVLNTLSGLKERGHDVVVITASPLFAAPQNDERVRVYRFFPFNLFFYGNDYKYPALARFLWHIFDTFNLHSYFVVKRILQKERPDIVHTHNLKGLGYLIPLAIRRLGLRHVHTLHDVQLVNPSGIIIKDKEEPGGLIGRLFYIYSRICRSLFGSPEVVISPSKFLLSFYQNRGFFTCSRMVVVPNPVVGGAATANAEYIAPSLVSPQSAASFSFLYLGQIEEHKGVLFLIDIFRKLAAGGAGKRAGMLLRIVGTGSKIDTAKRMAQGCLQIVFLGKVERPALPGIFQKTDFTIVPSLCYENSPTVIFESFSYGVPVLASDIEGVAELIKDGVNGFTFVTGETQSLAKKITFCLENRDQIRNMRQAARASIEGLGLSQYLDKLLNLYL